jgi:L-amino acid N-acyltransferase YncA
MIRPAAPGDCEAIARIYNHYILNTVVTFEEQAIAASDVAQRLKAVTAASLPWLVSQRAGEIVGYAYAGKWNTRSAYRYSVECTVYLDQSATGRGLGSELYDALFPILRRNEKHVVIAGISLPNDASVALHEKFGLKKVAHFGEVGFKFNRWVDVGYWQGFP